MDAASQEKGIPVYLDPLDRKLVDVTAESYSPNEWHPINQAADRALKCKEALHDILEILESYSQVKNPEKRRRRLRAIFVPLHSLCVNLVELLNQIQADKSVHDRFPANTTATVTRLRSHFLSLVPFDRKGKLGMLRNKISAHYERTMSPSEMRDLYNSTDSTETGEWLHIALAVFCDTLKLDAYTWSAAGPGDDTTTTMFQEPLMTVWRLSDSKPADILGFYMCKHSPRQLIFEQIQKVAKKSQCLFAKKSHYRISGFYQDSPEDWARSLELQVRGDVLAPELREQERADQSHAEQTTGIQPTRNDSP